MPELLPAVTDPDASRENAGFSVANDSIVASGRGCSSVSNERVAFPSGTSIGTISSPKRPAACASAPGR